MPSGKTPQLNLAVGSWGPAGPGQPVLQLETPVPAHGATGDPGVGECWDIQGTCGEQVETHRAALGAVGWLGPSLPALLCERTQPWGPPEVLGVPLAGTARGH